MYTLGYTEQVNLYRNHTRLAFALLALIIFVSSCVVIPTGTQTSSRGESGSIATVPGSPTPDSPRPASLEITSDPEDATVFLGFRRVGRTPLTLTDLEPGRYLVRLEKEGFYPEERAISLGRGESLVLDIELEQITGFLSVESNVDNPVIIVDGTTYTKDFIELPIGSYRVRIRSFGYRDLVAAIEIEPERQTRLEIELLPAPFEISELRVTRARFNPENPGILGRTGVTFEVSAPGEGVLLITDEQGRVVEEIPMGPFETWEQRVTWDGRDASGKALGRGSYSITLEATGRDGLRGKQRANLEIDPSLIVNYRSAWGGFPGLSFVPTPSSLPATTFQLTAQGAGTLAGPPHGLPRRYPIRFGLRVGLGTGLELGAHGGLVPTEDTTDTRWNVGGSLLYGNSLPTSGVVGIHLGGVVSGTYESSSISGSFASPDTFGSRGGVGIALPVMVRVNGFSALVSPGYRLAPAPISYDASPTPNEWTHYGVLRAGVLYDVSGFTVGLSGVAKSRLDDPFGVVPVHAGLDLSYVIPGSPVALSFLTAVEWSGVHAVYLQSGVGVGLLF